MWDLSKKCVMCVRDVSEKCVSRLLFERSIRFGGVGNKHETRAF